MIEQKLNEWMKNATADPDLIKELQAVKDDKNAVSDRFYKDLSFGTAGLRGEIGAGTNRMNVYTVGKATQGLAKYIQSVRKNGSAAIAYDSRIKSDLFARVAACILAANNIKVYLYRELMPTPMLSYAVRYYHCDAGIVITASHNPAKYNGYKAYGPDGCQLSPEASNYVLEIMNRVNPFTDIKTVSFDAALADGKIEYISDSVIDSYLNTVQTCSVSGGEDLTGLRVVFTPLNGTGNKPVREILRRIGITDVTVVKEQEMPDGNFPTSPYPNPEIKEAFALAIKLAETVQPDLLLATDPDCDRVGIAVKSGSEYRLMSGNDVGCLLLDYVLRRRTQSGTLPAHPIAVKTIVTSELCQKIADHYGCQLINVLTGFKFIGQQIGLLEAKKEESRFIFGFEESYGYLGGSYVRDKDAVIASMLICEMVAYYKKQGKSLLQALDGLYRQYGYYFCSQKSFSFEGEAGMKKMDSILSSLRNTPPKDIIGQSVVTVKDYLASVSTDITTGKSEAIDLPKSNVLAYTLEDGSLFIVRPSGTEPKIKFYFSAAAPTAMGCRDTLKMLEDACGEFTA